MKDMAPRDVAQVRRTPTPDTAECLSDELALTIFKREVQLMARRAHSAAGTGSRIRLHFQRLNLQLLQTNETT